MYQLVKTLSFLVSIFSLFVALNLEMNARAAEDFELCRLRALDNEAQHQYDKALADIKGLSDVGTLALRARLLFESHEYQQSILTCNEILKKWPADTNIIQLRSLAVKHLDPKVLAQNPDLSFPSTSESSKLLIPDSEWLKRELARSYCNAADGLLQHQADGLLHSPQERLDSRKEDLSLAESSMNKAMAIYPKGDFYIRNKGQIYIGDLYLWRRSKIYIAEGKYQQALDDLNKLIELEPKSGELYYMRNGCLDRLGKHELAAKDRARAIALDPYYKNTFLKYVRPTRISRRKKIRV